MPNSNRCIWCLGKPPNTIFNVSHVLPECVGNENQQVLPEGIVCKQCNNYFGTKVEPALLRDPLFHVIAVFLRLKDPDDMNEFRDSVFDGEHPPVGSVERKLDCNMEVSPGKLTLNVQYGIKGQLSKSYGRRELALLSRAAYKIAFETLAWTIFVKGVDENIDIFDSRFEPVRKWARYGQPVNSVRPMLRLQTPRLEPKWEYSLWRFGDSLGIELNLFGDLYAVSLTSSPDKAGDDLKKWVGSQRPEYPVWLVGEELVALT